MEELRKAIIEPDGRIRCPVCAKVNGQVTGDAVVKNFRIRCRASRRNHEHYFILNFDGGEMKND